MNPPYRYHPLQIPRRIILSPGPSSANPTVLRAMSQPIIGYLDPEYLSLLEFVEDMLREVFKTKQRAFAVAGSGSAGMEAGFASLLEQGDKVIVCSYGHFCERQVEMCKRLDAKVIELPSKWGQQMDPTILEEALRKHPDTKLVVAIHAETSAGTLQPISELSSIAHSFDALFMTDVVTSLAGCEVDFDGWQIDYAYSGSQKCLAAPPGISPVAISERAMEHIRVRKSPPSSWYLDLSLIADYWGSDHKPHHTNPVSMIYGLREALALVLNEGLEKRWTRHENVANALRSGLNALQLSSPVDKNARLNQLTVVSLPEGVNDQDFRNQLLRDYGIEIGRGLGQFTGKVVRIGTMGESCSISNVLTLLTALEAILPQHGYDVLPGSATAAASEALIANPVHVD